MDQILKIHISLTSDYFQNYNWEKLNMTKLLKWNEK